ncbi:MAG: calcium/sodium antiporter [Balneolales bacterium]
MVILLFFVGLILLILGAEALVRGASRMATAFHITPLVIGLTVVAYGTGAPEVAVGINAAISGQSDITIGNIIGSNIVNILLIMGLSAILTPLSASHKLVRMDVPLLIAVSAIVMGLSMNGFFTRMNGIILFSVLIIYTVYLIYRGRQSKEKREQIYDEHNDIQSNPPKIGAREIGLIIGGIAFLVIGSGWLVEGAVAFAQFFGLSELIIGLTIVSIGTSLPELTTAVVAGFRNERNMAVGNIVGSCLFNLLGVLGLSSIFTPADIPVAASVIWFDIPVMIAASIACLPIFFTDGIISRWEGALFLCFYFAYTAYLILAAAHHDALTVLSTAMIYFVIPLTAITLFVLSMMEIRKRNKRLKKI